MSDNSLIILSDLWGTDNASWISYYTKPLKSIFDIRLYDCRELAGIDANINQENIIHTQFLEGGIEKAVINLLKEENDEIIALGFSIGGLIAWRAALAGLKIQYMCLLSSSRLRYETEMPNCSMDLYYAEFDDFQPSGNWFQAHEIKRNIIKNEKHEFYRKNKFAKTICDNISANQVKARAD